MPPKKGKGKPNNLIQFRPSSKPSLGRLPENAAGEPVDLNEVRRRRLEFNASVDNARRISRRAFHESEKYRKFFSILAEDRKIPVNVQERLKRAHEELKRIVVLPDFAAEHDIIALQDFFGKFHDALVAIDEAYPRLKLMNRLRELSKEMPFRE